MNIDRDLQIAFAIHNAGVRRSRRDYEEHPTSACPWRPLKGHAACENLTDGVALCAEHLADKRVCRTCKKRQAVNRRRHCASCILVATGLCYKCGRNKAENRRRQCSTCAHGGPRSAAARMRRRRAGEGS